MRRRVQNMREKFKMGNQMDRELSILLMGSMQGQTRMGKEMVKEHTITVMEEIMQGDSRIENLGMENDITKKETSQESM